MGKKKKSYDYPDEMIMEILSWVPIKSLMRFRCVSKPWFRLLTTIDPHFIQLHFNRFIKTNPNPSILFLHNLGYFARSYTHCHIAEDYNSCDKSIELNVPHNNVSCRHFVISGISNGLLCLTNVPNEIFTHVCIWNPLTGENISIPCSPIPSYFEGFDVDTIFGFGFHHGTHEYKVIRVVSTAGVFNSEDEHLFRTHVCVYTLGTAGSWRSLESILDPFGIKSISEDSIVLVNDTLHFLAVKDCEIFNDDILSFDLKNEVFQEISLPNGVDYYNLNNVTLGELGGLLCVFCSYEGQGIYIWTMQQYGVVESWRNQFRIEVSYVYTTSYEFEPLGITNSGEIVDHECLLVYDPKTNSIRRLKNSGFRYYHVLEFVGSLVSPELINGVRRITDAEES